MLPGGQSVNSPGLFLPVLVLKISFCLPRKFMSTEESFEVPRGHLWLLALGRCSAGDSTLSKTINCFASFSCHVSAWPKVWLYIGENLHAGKTQICICNSSVIIPLSMHYFYHQVETLQSIIQCSTSTWSRCLHKQGGRLCALSEWIKKETQVNWSSFIIFWRQLSGFS